MANIIENTSKGIPTGSVSGYHSFAARDKRHIVRLRARARQPNNDLEVSVIVTNLSRAGCKIETLISLDPKSPVLISYKEYPTIRAQIMWSKTGAHGCKFDKPIPDHILLEILAGA